ncbi:uncharacterized protein EURHEDRAFT_133544 [Aspergillus ruber CBS 135680]|uniref:Uncharacterized protein n=1 Tax=Aspergillus ruber (strain CBS 135680) TaxID=1388766 RepID=A0A017SSJ8_ASPRC|nr:uncharacterized protein EURHEDRAFT_133544 [Aspergillus ruber CBS 135680]EYE99260.1 hypothetical protein EURHEDRAFT_133544 [Aspergillus ruber CBS 135680]
MRGHNVITFYQSTISKRFLRMTGKMALLMSTVLFSWYSSPPVSHSVLDRANKCTGSPNQPIWSPKRRESRSTQTPHPLLCGYGHLHGCNMWLYLAD